MPSSSSVFPTTSTTTNNHNSSSISPPNHGSTIGSSLLYPTIAGTTNSNSSNPSPLPSAISRKTPESFLGENFSNLVNLDQLVTEPKGNRKKTNFHRFFPSFIFLSGTTNPFGSTAPRAPNPFANIMKPPTLDQLSSSNNVGFTTGSTLPPPLIPSSFNANTSSINTNNPFM
jgi:hypothetical protein